MIGEREREREEKRKKERDCAHAEKVYACEEAKSISYFLVCPISEGIKQWSNCEANHSRR